MKPRHPAIYYTGSLQPRYDVLTAQFLDFLETEIPKYSKELLREVEPAVSLLASNTASTSRVTVRPPRQHALHTWPEHLSCGSHVPTRTKACLRRD